MTQRLSLALPLAVLLWLALASLATATASAQSRAFSAGEQRRLLSGELVRRDASGEREGRRLFGGTSFIRVRAPLDEVWAVVRDPARYTRLIPSLARVRVVERRDEQVLLWMQHRYALSTTAYHATMRFDAAAHRVEFELDASRPRDVDGGRGFLELASYEGDTIVSWGMIADVGDGLVARVFGPFLAEWLLKPPRCLRDEVEPGRVNQC